MPVLDSSAQCVVDYMPIRLEAPDAADVSLSEGWPCSLAATCFCCVLDALF